MLVARDKNKRTFQCDVLASRSHNLISTRNVFIIFCVCLQVSTS